MSRVILIGFDSVKINTEISDITLVAYSDDYPEDVSKAERIYLAYKEVTKSDLIIVNIERNNFSDLEHYILNVAYINNIPVFGCGKAEDLPFIIETKLLNVFPSLDEAIEHFKLYY